MTTLIWIAIIGWFGYRIISTLRRRQQPPGNARIPCLNSNCPHTILPTTAERTGGLCMPCFQGRTPGTTPSSSYQPPSYQESSDEIELDLFGEPVEADKPANSGQIQQHDSPLTPQPLKVLERPAPAPPPTAPTAWPEAVAHAASLGELCARPGQVGLAARRLLPHLQQPADHHVTCLAELAGDLRVPILVQGPTQTIVYHAHAGEWTPAGEQAFREWIQAVKSCSATSTAEIRIATDDLPSTLAVRARQADCVS